MVVRLGARPFQWSSLFSPNCTKNSFEEERARLPQVGSYRDSRLRYSRSRHIDKIPLLICLMRSCSACILSSASKPRGKCQACIACIACSERMCIQTLPSGGAPYPPCPKAPIALQPFSVFQRHLFYPPRSRVRYQDDVFRRG